MYKWSHSETGRACILVRTDLCSQNININFNQNKFQNYGYESCWIQINVPQKPPILFCSVYRQPGTDLNFIPEFEEKQRESLHLYSLVVISIT